jgi:hypothetical protein
MELNEPMEGHQHATTSLKVVLLIFAIVLVGALAYFVSATYNQPDSTDNTAPNVTKKAASTEENDALACADPGSSEKNYTSTAQGFCFNYPSSWTLTDGVGTESNITWYVSLTDKIVPDSDYPGQLSINKYKNLAALDTDSFGASTLKEYLDMAAAAADPKYINVAVATLGGLDAYKAEAGPNQFGGGTFYFVELSDKTIVVITVFADNAETKAVLDSMEFEN